jgi:cephalosporin hydroxylase
MQSLTTIQDPLLIPSFVSNAREAQGVVDAFHKLYYYRRLWDGTTWMGVKVYKCPLDLWIYQEILHAARPDVVIETGTASGGSALYMAHLMDIIGHGRIITIDITQDAGRPSHPRIEYIQGSSIDPKIRARVESRMSPGERPLIILDSLHSRDHVLDELRLWSPLVPVGGHLIVEDTNINGRPVHTDFAPDAGPGAGDAVDEFLRETGLRESGQSSPAGGPQFVVNRTAERLLLTFNPGGYLTRTAGPASGA